MIAVDTNILVYAHRQDSEWNVAASQNVKDLAESSSNWAIPWPCIHEFVAVVTNQRIYRPPSTLDQALRQVEYWMQSPSLILVGESEGYWPVFKEIASKARLSGGAVHDARIASICVANGIRELWTSDRDFSRFPEIKTKNPLVAA